MCLGQGGAQLLQALCVKALNQRDMRVRVQALHQRIGQFFVEHDVFFQGGHQHLIQEWARRWAALSCGATGSLVVGLSIRVSSTEISSAPLISRYEAPGEPVSLFK